VIKTNRIVNSPLTKGAGENLPREFVSLYERGNLKSGLFRGLLPSLGATFFWKEVANQSKNGLPVITLVLGTLTLNPFANLVTKKQIVAQNEINPLSYKQIAFGNGVSGIFRLFTLGLSAHIFRNFALSLALVPREYGSSFEPLQALYALGAILVSHPFEVARVLIVNNGEGRLDATLTSLY
jgi:hypothetical protein